MHSASIDRIRRWTSNKLELQEVLSHSKRKGQRRSQSMNLVKLPCLTIVWHAKWKMSRMLTHRLKQLLPIRIRGPFATLKEAFERGCYYACECRRSGRIQGWKEVLCHCWYLIILDLFKKGWSLFAEVLYPGPAWNSLPCISCHLPCRKLSLSLALSITLSPSGTFLCRVAEFTIASHPL